jgi:hypothetical protein
MWLLEDLVRFSKENSTQINGVWYPSRPIYRTWFSRLKDAWEVYRGRADAVKWPGGQ